MDLTFFQLNRLMIGHTNAGMHAGWFLDSVQIMVPLHGKHYMFPCHRWLDKDEADGKMQVEIYPSEILDVEQCRQHSQSNCIINYWSTPMGFEGHTILDSNCASLGSIFTVWLNVLVFLCVVTLLSRVYRIHISYNLTFFCFFFQSLTMRWLLWLETWHLQAPMPGCLSRSTETGGRRRLSQSKADPATMSATLQKYLRYQKLSTQNIIQIGETCLFLFQLKYSPTDRSQRCGENIQNPHRSRRLGNWVGMVPGNSVRQAFNHGAGAQGEEERWQEKEEEKEEGQRGWRRSWWRGDARSGSDLPFPLFTLVGQWRGRRWAGSGTAAWGCQRAAR